MSLSLDASKGNRAIPFSDVSLHGFNRAIVDEMVAHDRHGFEKAKKKTFVIFRVNLGDGPLPFAEPLIGGGSTSYNGASAMYLFSETKAKEYFKKGTNAKDWDGIHYADSLAMRGIALLVFPLGVQTPIRSTLGLATVIAETNNARLVHAERVKLLTSEQSVISEPDVKQLPEPKNLPQVSEDVIQGEVIPWNASLPV